MHVRGQLWFGIPFLGVTVHQDERMEWNPEHVDLIQLSVETLNCSVSRLSYFKYSAIDGTTLSALLPAGSENA